MKTEFEIIMQGLENKRLEYEKMVRDTQILLEKDR